MDCRLRGLIRISAKACVLGLPPSASELQYIDKKRIDEARKRVQQALANEPLIAGFDVSGGGKAWNVIRFRRGLDGNLWHGADTHPRRKRRQSRVQRLGHLRRAIARPKTRTEAGSVVRGIQPLALRSPLAFVISGFTNVFEVNSGGESPDIHCLNMRSFATWMKGKEWLLLGGLRNGR